MLPHHHIRVSIASAPLTIVYAPVDTPLLRLPPSDMCKFLSLLTTYTVILTRTKSYIASYLASKCKCAPISLLFQSLCVLFLLPRRLPIVSQDPARCRITICVP